MNIFTNQNAGSPYPPPPYSTVYSNGNPVITTAPSYPPNFLTGSEYGKSGPFVIPSGPPGIMPSTLDCLSSILGQAGTWRFFQDSSIGLVRRTILLQLRNQNGQPLMSVQHIPGQTFNSGHHHHHHGGVSHGGTSIQIGSVTKFTDPSGRVIMMAAEGDGWSTTTTVSSGEFILGFVEQSVVCCGLCCPDETGGTLVGKNGMGESIITVHRGSMGGWSFMDMMQGREVGGLSAQDSGTVDLVMLPDIDTKVKAIVLNLAFCMFMRHYAQTMCGRGQLRCGRISAGIGCLCLLVPVIIFLIAFGCMGGFMKRSYDKHRAEFDSFGSGTG